MKTVIIHVIYYRWGTSYAADILKQYPQYFQGVVRVNPEDPAAPDHMSRLVEQQRFLGDRLSPAGIETGDWIRSPFLSEEDKSWILSKTVERVRPFD